LKRKPLTLLLVDDHEIVRTGLRTLLSTESDLRVLAEAGTGNEAVSQAVRFMPDIVLLDVKLPDASGTKTCRDILSACPTTRVIFLSSYWDEEAVLAAIQAGAHGFATKEIHTEDLLRAIRSVANGHAFLDSGIADTTLRLMRRHSKSITKQSDMPALSPQERSIVCLVAEGKTNKEISVVLGLSDKTVKNYLANVYGKLHVSRRSQAAVYYSRHLAPAKSSASS
jgi:DNA-binding NarL/FixJ family response regulator